MIVNIFLFIGLTTSSEGKTYLNGKLYTAFTTVTKLMTPVSQQLVNMLQRT